MIDILLTFLPEFTSEYLPIKIRKEGIKISEQLGNNLGMIQRQKLSIVWNYIIMIIFHF